MANQILTIPDRITLGSYGFLIFSNSQLSSNNNLIRNGAYQLLGGVNMSIGGLQGRNIAWGEGNFIDGDYNAVFGYANAATAVGNIVGGRNNTITGFVGWGLVVGAYHTVSGHANMVGGNDTSGEGSTVSGKNNLVVGSGHNVTGDNNVVGCGVSTAGNTVSGDWNAVFGYVNTVVGDRSLVCGQSNSVDGSDAVCVGDNMIVNAPHSAGFGYYAQIETAAEFGFAVGKQVKVSKPAGAAIGWGAWSNLHGELAHTGNSFDTNGKLGDAQHSFVIAKAVTGDATQTTLTLNFAGDEYIDLKDDRTYFFTVTAVARNMDDDTESAAYKLEFEAERGSGAGTTEINGLVKTVFHEDIAAWDITAVANTTDGRVDLKVTGEVDTNIRWVAKVEIVQVLG